MKKYICNIDELRTDRSRGDNNNKDDTHTTPKPSLIESETADDPDYIDMIRALDKLIVYRNTHKKMTKEQDAVSCRAFSTIP